MKTLANCALSEFLPTAYRVREVFHKYYHLIDVDRLRDRYASRYQNDTNGKEISKEFIKEIVYSMMVTHSVETVELIALLAFMTKEEAEQLAPNTAFKVILSCLCSERVMDFFINLEHSAGGDTDGILRTLILLRLSASGMDISEIVSQNSTNNSNENAFAGDTSENA